MAKIPNEAQLKALAKDLNSKAHIEVVDSVPSSLTSGDVVALSGGKITGDMIADGAIESKHIKDGTITTGDLANSIITSDKLANSAVTSGKIANGAVKSDNIDWSTLPYYSSSTQRGYTISNIWTMLVTAIVPTSGVYLFLACTGCYGNQGIDVSGDYLEGEILVNGTTVAHQLTSFAHDRGSVTCMALRQCNATHTVIFRAKTGAYPTTTEKRDTSLYMFRVA